MASSAVMLVGGDSRLARRIARIVPCRPVVRRPTADPAAIVVADYRDVPVAAFDGITSVVNCVGTPRGSAATLDAVNVAVPLAVATRARACGCRQFIQLGSLSVYGGATVIDAATPVRPAAAYGRSKAAADAALLALATPAFGVVALRVPALYGVGAAGKFGQLARLMALLGWFPDTDPPARRSVLHLDNAAAAIAALLADYTSTGVRLAADHDDLTLADVAAAVAAGRGRPIRRVPLPAAATGMLRRVAPGVVASLYADSRIVPAAAMTTALSLPVTLHDGLAAMLAAAA